MLVIDMCVRMYWRLLNSIELFSFIFILDFEKSNERKDRRPLFCLESTCRCSTMHRNWNDIYLANIVFIFQVVMLFCCLFRLLHALVSFFICLFSQTKNSTNKQKHINGIEWICRSVNTLRSTPYIKRNIYIYTLQ